MKIQTPLLLSVRTALGLVFVVSGFQKLTSPYQNFAAVIETFEIVRGVPAEWLAQTLPWVEFVAGVFFIAGLWETLCLAVLWLMNTAFIGVLVSALARKLPIDSCGCFGDAAALSLPKMLALDMVFWASFFAYFFMRRRTDIPGLDRAFRAHGAR